jgi:branched-chain amino acid transport system ATP-binding protein
MNDIQSAAGVIPAETPAPHPAIEVRSVRAGYGGGDVLRDVSLTVKQGGVTVLLGPNGAGKSTLLKTISGLLPLRAGTVLLDGTDCALDPPERRARRGLLHITEGRGIYRSLTVRENLAMQSAGGGKKLAIEKAAEVFPVLGKRLKQIAGTMSGGEQQMLALAAAYVRDARIIVVDEPSLGLAPIIVDAVFDYLRRISSAGVSLLLVDQFAHRALALADRAYVLRQGEIVFTGGAAELERGDVFEHYLGTRDA